jgi:hypothetical protein
MNIFLKFLHSFYVKICRNLELIRDLKRYFWILSKKPMVIVCFIEFYSIFENIVLLNKLIKN